MANELSFMWESGQANIQANVYQPDGTARSGDGYSNPASLTESGSTGLYLADCAPIENGDKVIYSQNGIFLGGERYYAERPGSLSFERETSTVVYASDKPPASGTVERDTVVVSGNTEVARVAEIDVPVSYVSTTTEPVLDRESMVSTQ